MDMVKFYRVTKSNKFVWSLKPCLNFQKGFTLVELMVVMAIIGVLAAVAVPNFIAYRDKGRIAASTATIESIRGGMAAYSADSQSNLFPAVFTDWAALVSVMNANGCTLNVVAADQGFKAAFTYDSFDADGDGVDDDYYFIFQAAGVPRTMSGSQFEMRPSGIMKQTY